MKTKTLIISVIIIVVILLLSTIRIYNRFVKFEEDVKTAWSQVETQYQRRADLIPNLVNTVKGYAQHEQETLEEVVKARASATNTKVNYDDINENILAQYQSTQDILSEALSRLLLVIERYPDLKANENFITLQSQLESTENRIAYERRRFNEVSKEYNTYVRRFPTNLFARLFSFTEKPYFKSVEGAKDAVEVSF
ncbi:MAG: LemA family protein [Lentimicrobiaceae bacterium]|nr:LemA family protein [Lentimicrobiaceae bacterium]